ncbi:MAG TPA: FkbM family methyltransferase [Chitinophagaceae bacterium]|nr:FkbM family methyltransferase [Chitinophagaceae bacterium]
MKLIRKLLQKILSEEQYLGLLSSGFQRLFKTGRLGDEYQDVYFLKNMIMPGDVCVDIGAHLGYYTFQLSRLAGGTGKVIAIEPVGKFHSVLQKQIARNRWANIELHKVALGGSGEFVEIGIPKINNQKKFGHARIRELSDWLEYVESEKVPNTSGDKLLANLSRLDFIKCDVEGAEVPVFSSMLSVLQQHRPVILCELADKNERIKMNDMLSPFDYSIYILKKEKLYRIDAHSDLRAISHNHYFIPASRLDRYRALLA